MRIEPQDNEFIRTVNLEIKQLSQLKHFQLGPEYASLSGEAVREHLSIHRMAKKFEEPSTQGAAERKKFSLQSVLDHDSNGLPSWQRFEPHRTVSDPEVKKVLYKARLSLKEKVNKSFNLTLDAVTFPSGETFVSSQGHVSLLDKLRDHTQWCITIGSLPLFTRIAHKHRALKKMVKEHWKRKVLYSDGPQKPNALLKEERALWRKYQCPKAVFAAKVKSIVTFVVGARFTTVRKNNETDRVIECEAMLDMICQRVIAHGIHKVLRLEYGIITTLGQTVHKSLIQGQCDTTDLKNASNSIWMQTLRWFLEDTYLLKLVEKTRSQVVSVSGEYHPLNMVAPMGNGFTFEIMTLLLIGIAREIDPRATVYGDDIITFQGTTQLHACLEAIGLQINVDKTFVNSPFRESCGGFYHDDVGYIQTFEFEWALDLYDAIVLTNKLKLIIGNINTYRAIFEAAYRRILLAVPPLCLVLGTVSRETLGEGVFVTKSHLRRVHKSIRSSVPRRVAEKQRAATKDLISRYSLTSSNCIYLKRQISKENFTKNAPVHIRDTEWFYYYLYSGRRTRPEIRRTRTVSRYVLCVDTHHVIIEL